MAIVRCRTHKIPYNDLNPRGCPACAQEKSGRHSRAAAMRELARASQSVTTRSGVTTPAPALRGARDTFEGPGLLSRAVGFLRERFLLVAVPAVAVLVFVVVVAARPRFSEQLNPPPLSGTARPLSVSPNQPVQVAFSMLGQQAARPHRKYRSVQVYSYGTDLVIETINNLIYKISLAIPNRSWNGLRVGMSEQQAKGSLAILGNPTERGPTVPTRPDTLGGYVVFRSLDARPTRTVEARVRPPNGCYDVRLSLKPRALGFVFSGTRKYAAVAKPGDPMSWVVAKIEVLSRRIRGPETGPPVC